MKFIKIRQRVSREYDYRLGERTRLACSSQRVAENISE